MKKNRLLTLLLTILSLTVTAQDNSINYATEEHYREMFDMGIHFPFFLVENTANPNGKKDRLKLELSDIGDIMYINSLKIIGSLNNADFESLRYIKELNLSTIDIIGNIRVTKSDKKNDFATIKAIPACAFMDNTELERVTLPSVCTKILPYTFNNATALTTVIIESNVREIGDYAFGGCHNLKYIYVRWSNRLPYISKDAFYGVDTKNITLIIPKGQTALYKNNDVLKGFNIIEYDNELNKKQTEGYIGPTFLHLPDLKTSIASFRRWTSNNMKTPIVFEEIKGKSEVVCKIYFRIDKDGSVYDVAIASPLSRDAEAAIRDVLMTSPPWRPAIFRGKPSVSTINHFRLIYKF